MRRVTRMLVLCALLAGLALMVYQWLPPPESGLKAVEKLKNVQTFSFGRVGPRGEVPESVDQFTIILRSRHSSRLFRDLYQRGTPEAKVYALCGLWFTHGGFDRYAARFPQDVEKVSTLSSCIGKEYSSGEVVDAIRDGAVDRQLKLMCK